MSLSDGIFQQAIDISSTPSEWIVLAWLVSSGGYLNSEIRYTCVVGISGWNPRILRRLAQP